MGKDRKLVAAENVGLLPDVVIDEADSVDGQPPQQHRPAGWRKEIPGEVQANGHLVRDHRLLEGPLVPALPGKNIMKPASQFGERPIFTAPAAANRNSSLSFVMNAAEARSR